MKSGIKIEIFDNEGNVVLEGKPAEIIEDLAAGLALAVNMISDGFEDKRIGREAVLNTLFKLTREEFKESSIEVCSQSGEGKN